MRSAQALGLTAGQLWKLTFLETGLMGATTGCSRSRSEQGLRIADCRFMITWYSSLGERTWHDN